MLKGITRCAVILACCLLLSSCAHLTSSGRQQLAYAKYVKKQSHNRVKQRTKFKKVSIPAPGPSERKETNGTKDGPQSVTSGESPGQ